MKKYHIDQRILKLQGCGFHRCQHKLAEHKKGQDLPENPSHHNTGGNSSSSNPSGSGSKPSDKDSNRKGKESNSAKDISTTASNARRKVSSYFFGKFFEFVQRYQTWLGKMFPGAMHVYRVFVVGFKVKLIFIMHKLKHK